MSNRRWMIVAWCLLGVGLLLFPYADARESVGFGVVCIATCAMAMGIVLRGLVDEMVRGTSCEDRS